MRGSWRPNRTAIYWPPTLMAISVVSFLFSRADQPEARGLSSLVDDSFLCRILSLTQFLEWHVWSSSSGNKCHAVHRSLSSGASVYEGTMEFYLVIYCQPSPPTRFLLITAIRMCHFLPEHHIRMACLVGSKVNIQHCFESAYLPGMDLTLPQPFSTRKA